MRYLLSVLLLALSLEGQTATRTVTLTWSNTNPAGTVLGSVISNGTSSTGPFTQIGCTGTVAGSACVSGSTATTLTYNDTENVGSTVYYQIYFVAAACTPTTPVGTPCGNSPPITSAAVPIPPKSAAPGTIVVIVQ